MPVPRVRFTVRRLMAVVMLVAVLMWGVQTWRRWQAYRRSAMYYAQVELWSGQEVAWMDRSITQARHRLPEELRISQHALRHFINDREVTPAEFAASQEKVVADMFAMAAQKRAQVAFFARMKRKYERAARYPWLPVEPDPPVPNVDWPGWPMDEK